MVTSYVILESTLVSQTIAGLVPGQTYTLSFQYANVGAEVFQFPEPYGEAGQIDVSIAGQTFQTDLVDYLGAGEQTWYAASFDFTADAATSTLQMWTHDANFFGGIDGVSIVPEPGGVTLFGLAVLGWCVFVWRRRG